METGNQSGSNLWPVSEVREPSSSGSPSSGWSGKGGQDAETDEDQDLNWDQQHQRRNNENLETARLLEQQSISGISGYQSLPSLADAADSVFANVSATHYSDVSDISDDGMVVQRRLHAVRVAAMYIKAALFDRRISYLTDPESLWLVRIYESTGMRMLVDAALIAYLLITFYEKNDGTQPVWTYIVEALSWSYLALMFSLRIRFTDFKQLQRSRFAKIHATALAIALVDLLASVFFAVICKKPYYRFARVVRPVFQLEYSHLVRRRVLDILRTCWRVRAVFLLLAFEITFFAVVAIFLFYGSPEGDQFFNSMGQSIVTLVILLSTCNSPSVMVPAYKSNPWSALFFVCYLVVSVFLMLNLTLAVIYKEHRRHLLWEAKRQAIRKRACTSAAFRVLRQEYIQSMEPILRPTNLRGVGLPDGLVADLMIELGVRVEDAPVLVTLLGDGRRPGFVFRDEFEDVLLVVHFTIKEHVSEEEEVEAILGENDMVAAADAEAVATADRVRATEDAEQSTDQDGNVGENTYTSQGTNNSQYFSNFNYSNGGTPTSSLYGLENEFDTGSIAPGLHHPYYNGRRTHEGSTANMNTSSRSMRSSSFTRSSDAPRTPLTESDFDESTPTSMRTALKKAARMSSSRRMAIRVVKHRTWVPFFGKVQTLDFAVNALLVVSGCITVTALTIDIDVIIYDDPLPFRIINTCCTLLFSAEVAIRMHAARPRRFFESSWNTFEFCVVVSSLVGTLSQILRLRLGGHTHLFLFLRKLRLLRLLRSVSQFRLLTEMIVYLLPALYVFSRVIFFFMYITAIVAMGSLKMQLENEAEFGATNFITFANSLLTLFQLLVVNDWNMTMNGYYKATGNALVYVFFILNYLFSVIVVLNVITSFALEALDKSISEFALLQDANPSNPDETSFINGSDSQEKIIREQARIMERRHNSRRERELFSRSKAGSGHVHEERELKRTFSYVERLPTLRKVGRVIRTSPRESHLVRLLREVFDNEMDEPSMAEVNRELHRNGLANLLARPNQSSQSQVT